MFKGVHDKTTDFLKDSIKESYTETAFELQKGMGKGFTMEVPYDEHKLENILSSPWASDGKNFSSRIWKRKDKLVNELKKNLSESVIRGDSDTEAIKALSIDADKAEFNTRRIIETESAFFDSESERQCCEDFGIEKYRFLAVLDLKTSDICQELDNKVFLEKERQIGVNAPPMHPFCRSTTAPVVDEEFLTSRRAKNIKTGEYDEIPPDMNYKQWKEKYVEGKENVEEVKQEQVKAETPNGYEIKLENKNVDNQYKETPLESKTSKFNSNAYENKIKKQAEKNNALIERVENNKDIPKELKNNIKSIIKDNEKLYASYQILEKEGTELAEVNFTYHPLDKSVTFTEKEFKNNCAKIPNCIYDLLFECGLIKEEKEEFLSKFDINNFINKMIEYGQKIIKDNAGKDTETTFIITSLGKNSEGQELKEKDFNQSDKKHENCLTDEQKIQLHNLNIQKVIHFLIHNHSTDSPPSPKDYNNFYAYQYTCGIIFTNKGSIYIFVGTNEDINSLNLIDIDTLNVIKNTINLNRVLLNNNNENEIFATTYNSYNFSKYGFKFIHIGENGKKYYSYKKR